MRDTLDILQEHEMQDCMAMMKDYFRKNIKAFQSYLYFPRKELVFHRGVFYNDELIGYCIYGLELSGIHAPETVVFVLFIKPEYRQRGFSRMVIDDLHYYQLPISVFKGENDWFSETDLAKEVKIV